MRAPVLVALLALGACGGSSASPEVVVADATLGGGSPTVLGASAAAVYWTVGASPRQLGGAALDPLPAEAMPVATLPGAAVAIGDHVVFADGAAIVRVGLADAPEQVVRDTAEAVGASDEAPPIVAWTQGPLVQWGNGDTHEMATLPKVVRCDHLRMTGTSLYVAADSMTDRRLMRIDRATSAVTPVAGSAVMADAFPGGAIDGATYRGRLVGADAIGAAWLVEETPAGATSPSRAIVSTIPEHGTATVVLEHVGAATGFFVTDDAFYWQEGDALLTAPRQGGAASIIAHIAGAAGAVADGFVYYADGGAVMRLALASE